VEIEISPSIDSLIEVPKNPPAIPGPHETELVCVDVGRM